MCPSGAQQNVEGTPKLGNLRSSYLQWNGQVQEKQQRTILCPIVSRRATPGLRGRALTQQKELFCGVLLMQLWPLVEPCSQFTAQQGGSQGNTQSKLTVLCLQISCWCYPLAEPNWKPEARAPGCSAYGSASWSAEQGEGWRTDLGGEVEDTAHACHPVLSLSQVQIFSQKAELEITYVA